MKMSFTRVVWSEGIKEFEDVVPSTWVDGLTLRWPVGGEPSEGHERASASSAKLEEMYC